MILKNNNKSGLKILKMNLLNRASILFSIVILLLGNLSLAQSKLDSTQVRISEILQENNVPGASIMVVSKDSVLCSYQFGYQDLKEKTPVTKETLFSIGSISKTFIAMAAMKAQEDSFFQINQSLKTLLPSINFENKWEDKAPVRFIHLLEHTSGFDEAHLDLTARANANTPLDSVMIAGKNAFIARWEPGNYYAYNTIGAVMAAYIIEKQVEEPFEDYVSASILHPLSINGSSYKIHPEFEKHIAKGYLGIENDPQPFPDLPQWPAGSLLMSSTDFAKVIQLFLNDGTYENTEILKPSSIRSMETPESSLKAENNVLWDYGKGLQIKNENGHVFYGHDGRYVSYLSEFGYSRDLGIGYVILLNNGDAGKALKSVKKEILKSFFNAKESDVFEAIPKNIPFNDHLTGCYQPYTSSMELTQFAMRLIDIQFIVEENGQLYQKSILGEKRRLIHMGANRFRYSEEPVATSVFLKKEGEWQWLSESAYVKTDIWLGYSQFYLAVFCVLIMLLTLLYYFFLIPWKLLKRRKKNLKFQWPVCLALISFLLMVLSILMLYDPQTIYSAGAILFYVFGILFFIISLYGLFRILIGVFRKEIVGTWLKWQLVLSSTSNSIVAIYFLYWGLIGLRLWNY